MWDDLSTNLSFIAKATDRSIKEILDEAGISHSRYYGPNSRRKNLTLEDVEKIAGVLGVKAIDLLEPNGGVDIYNAKRLDEMMKMKEHLGVAYWEEMKKRGNIGRRSIKVAIKYGLI